MKTIKKIGILIACSLLAFSCSKKTSSAISIAVFAPGILADSPIYAMLAEGVSEAVEEYNAANNTKVEVSVFEAGTNQAEWQPKITAVASTGKYDLIISSNPSLPDLVLPLTEQFPNQKFILLDATCEGNKNIATVCYNQYEQSYLTGYIAGLMSKNHALALIAAQEYPVMNNVIYPYFEKGGKAAYADTTVDFRIVGNWYDAVKGAELADAVAKKGVDVILPICGGASQGVVNSAVNNGIYVTWFDSNGFERAPGTVISSTVMEQKKMSKGITLDYLNGKTEWSTAKIVGMKEGYIDFVQDDPNYISAVPADVREKMASLINDIKSGKVVIQ